jgi:electron transfer flavoprotein beta subunit
VEIREKSLVVSVSMDKTMEEWEIDYPCLITVDKGIFTPRLPSFKRGRLFKDFKIKVLGFSDMDDQDENHYGLKGSPTQVERMFPPERITDKETWHGNADELATRMAAKMKELKVL